MGLPTNQDGENISQRIADDGASQFVGLPQGLFGREMRLTNLKTKPQILTENTPPDDARRIPQATFNPGHYGEAQSVIVTVSTTGTLALQRPQFKRTLLIIQNPTGANLLFAFGARPTAGSNFIPPGGGLLFDAIVPQNDLYLSSSAGPVGIPFTYINADIANAQ